MPHKAMILAITLLIFIGTLTLIIARPRPFNEATATLLGACLMIGAGLVSLPQAWAVLQANTNILLFFLGLMLISTVAEKAGFFEWSAVKALRLSGGRGWQLLLIVFGLGTILTIFLSNDATALILTPIVFVLVKKLKLHALPYVFACAFIANTASVVLPVSNPVNLLPVDQFNIGLIDYLRYLFLPALVAVGINIGLFFLVFRHDIQARFQNYHLHNRITVDAFFLFVCTGLLLTAGGYIYASLRGLPLAWPALGGAVFLLTGALLRRRIDLRTTVKGISWTIFPFIFALSLLVKGLDNAGVTRALGELMANLAAQDTLKAILSTTFGTAIGANLVNNWSMMMASISGMASLGSQVDPGILYATVLGADLGPNLTIFGSLSSMLWLVILRRQGLDLRGTQYLKLGLIVTPPMLLGAALALYACSRLWG